jgi:hypothetical protein
VSDGAIVLSYCPLCGERLPDGALVRNVMIGRRLFMVHRSCKDIRPVTEFPDNRPSGFAGGGA